MVAARAVSTLAPDLYEREYPSSSRSRRAVAGGNNRQQKKLRSYTVTGQCSRCLDLFSVDLYVDRSRLCVSETPRLKWEEYQQGQPLIHHPTQCGGKVRLYGTLEGFLSPEELRRYRTTGTI